MTRTIIILALAGSVGTAWGQTATVCGSLGLIDCNAPIGGVWTLPQLNVGAGGSGATVLSTGVVTAAPSLHCVIAIPRPMWPVPGIADPAHTDYASITWEDDKGHAAQNYVPGGPTGCVIKEPNP